MTYSIHADGSVTLDHGDGRCTRLPAAGNGTAAWSDYEKWLAEGNTPLIAEDPVKPDYMAFWLALTASSLYQSVRAEAASSLPLNAAVTELIALLGDAKAGYPQQVLLQSAVESVLSLATLSDDQLSELQAAIEAANLSAVISLR